MALPQPFSPTRWLEEFNAVGGVCWFRSSDDMHVAWRIDGKTCDETMEARRLYDLVEHSDERETLWLQIEAVVRSRLPHSPVTLH